MVIEDDVRDLRIVLQELSELRRRVYSTTQLYTVSRACHNLVEYCTQTADPFLDGFGEVNPWKRSAHKAEADASKRSRDIEQLLAPSSKIQVICLAAPESNFEEILRKINSNRSFSTTEIDEYKRYLKQNLLTVLRHVTKIAGSSMSEHNQNLYKRLIRDDHGTNFDGIMTTNTADAMRSLWKDPAVHQAYNSICPSPFLSDLIGNLTVEGIVMYVDHLMDPSFAPTPMDANHSFDHATGIREVHLQGDQSEHHIQLLDFTNLPVVGEGEFCKHSWVSLFQNCNFIYCYVPLHTYDEKIDHENPLNPSSTNRNSKTQSTPSQIPTNPTKSPTANLIKSVSMGSSLPSSSKPDTLTRTRASSTNAKFSVSPKLAPKKMRSPRLGTSSELPNEQLTEQPLEPSPPSPEQSPPIFISPPRQSTLPPQLMGFDFGADPPGPKRKSNYRNSVIIKPTTAHNFVRSTVQEKKTKSVHVAASHRFNSPSTTPIASPNSSPLLTSHSPPRPPSPPSPSSSSSPLAQTSHPQSIPPQSKKRPTGSFLIMSSSPSSPPSPTPSLSPPKVHSTSLFSPLKVGRRKSMDLLSPLDRVRANTSALIPSPNNNSNSSSNNNNNNTTTTLHTSSSAPSRRSTHERSSVSYGSITPLSLITLPASPTLADIFKLPCYLKRFSALVNDESLLQVPVLVTFVVSQAFLEKIKDVDLDVCFPEYQGDHTEQSALDFLKRTFTEQNANPTRKIITTVLHTTNGIDDPTNGVKSVLTNAFSSFLY